MLGDYSLLTHQRQVALNDFNTDRREARGVDATDFPLKADGMPRILMTATAGGESYLELHADRPDEESIVRTGIEEVEHRLDLRQHRTYQEAALDVQRHPVGARPLCHNPDPKPTRGPETHFGPAIQEAVAEAVDADDVLALGVQFEASPHQIQLQRRDDAVSLSDDDAEHGRQLERDCFPELKIPTDEARSLPPIFVVVASFEVRRSAIDSHGRLDVVVLVR
jgi:hypothetical protein